jgi:hypothetical protein
MLFVFVSVLSMRKRHTFSRHAEEKRTLGLYNLLLSLTDGLSFDFNRLMLIVTLYVVRGSSPHGRSP